MTAIFAGYADMRLKNYAGGRTKNASHTRPPPHEICACCGGEVGLNDSIPAFVRKNRRDWGVGADMQWDRAQQKPANWSWEEQKKQIPPAFRDLGDGGWPEGDEESGISQ